MKNTTQILELNSSNIAVKKKSIYRKKIGNPNNHISKENNTYSIENNFQINTNLEKQKIFTEIGKEELMLKEGIFNQEIIDAIRTNYSEIYKIINRYKYELELPKKNIINLVYETDWGKLYEGDCLELFKEIKNESIDCIFADPPFNLNKLYPSKIDDNLKEEKYINWCYLWLQESVRTLKPGGSLFVWNLPKWNSIFSGFLHEKLTFKHWISVDIKNSLPIQGRLYPSHYSLLYFIKGKKPNTFRPDRLPMQTCPHCYGDIKDYGGYKNKMNPSGINLTDIWLDISPVRHAKYKRRQGANELPIKLLDRIIELSTKEGDMIFDPFGGSGTTYITAELKKRRWIGCEIGSTDVIVDRFKMIEEEMRILQESRSKINHLFPEKIKKEREKRKLWVCGKN